METIRHGNIGFLTGQWPPHPAWPTLILIHGAGFTNVLWREQISALSGIANAIAIDLPGHGASAGPGCDSIAAYAARVLEFMDAIKAPRPIVCGHSMGGAIVQRLLVDLPARFAAGVLINTGARLKVRPDVIEAVSADYQAFVAGLGQFTLSPQSDRARLQPLIHEACAHLDPAVVRADYEACNAFDVMNDLARIEVPALVVAGRDDIVTPPKYGEYLAVHLPHARLSTIGAAGHLAPFEQPQAVSDAIIHFIQGL